MSTESILFSIIIPTFERHALLAKCLDQFAPGVQSLSKSLYEVIVTDDSRNDLTKAIIQKEYSWAKWTRGPKRGPAANRNNGASLSNSDWLVFIDDDCEPGIDILEQFRVVINQGSAVEVLEGKIEPEGHKLSPLQYAPINMTGGHLLSCNFCILRKLFKELGGFDEHFIYPHLEDNDLRDRIVSINKMIVFASEAKVIHPWRYLTDGFKLGKYQEMYFYYYYKWGRNPKVLILLKAITVSHYSMMKGFPFSRDLLRAIAIMFEHQFFVLFNYRKWKKKYVE